MRAHAHAMFEKSGRLQSLVLQSLPPPTGMSSDSPRL
eukprot:CAMPEP_0197937340 /NCGR_PEP_ID=MMETSP1439-20131203/116368_1 /TAXON_ID=66791 /ORGANISM="Gonyaulax spinifera, Strain CCMP409" /LENGTH=36 /DNA_ID= /DNA_START= /DNA_END= /DNA_ORIENTATION=